MANWFTRVLNGTNEERAVGGPELGVIPPAWNTTTSVSIDEALSIGAVYRAVSIITTSVSQMPLGVFRNGVEIDTPTLIKQPNVNESARAFVSKTVWSLATSGNAYWRITGNYPSIQNLEVLDPASVSVWTDNGKVRYSIAGKEIDAKKIKHLRLEPRPGQALGIGPIQRGQQELLSALRLKHFQDYWFGSAGVPTGVLTTDQTLTAAQQEAYATAWTQFVRDNGIAVLGNGMRFEHLNLNPAQAQFLEISQAKVVAIARLFGMPPTLMASGNEGTSNTYINQQELFLQFLMTTLTVYMNEIEDALSSLLPRGQEVSFKEAALLRMDTVTQTEVWKTEIEAGITTPNEVRALKGLPPLATPAVNTEVKDTTEDDES